MIFQNGPLGTAYRRLAAEPHFACGFEIYSYVAWREIVEVIRLMREVHDIPAILRAERSGGA